MTPSEPLGRSRPSALLAVLLVASFLVSADSTITNVATPSIRASLGASGSAVQFVVGGYLVAYAVLLITGARLGQTHGCKRLFLTGVGAFGLCSLAAGVAPDLGVLIAMRVFQGAAAALMLPQVLTGIKLHFDGERRSHAIGLHAVALSVGAVAGQVLGGVLISADIAGQTWRPAFLINVPICLAALAFGINILPAYDRRTRSRLDLVGVAILSIAVLCLVVPLTVGPDTGWSAWTWATLGSCYATYVALLFTLAQYLQTRLHRSALFSGLILVPWAAAFGLAGQTRRHLPIRLLPALPVAAFVLLAIAYLAIGAGGLATVLSTPLLAILFIPGGFGLGVLFTSLLGHLMGAASQQHAPISAASAPRSPRSVGHSASPASAPSTSPPPTPTVPVTPSGSPPSPSQPPPSWPASPPCGC
ncbi:MAG: MFS transporter [Acidimicrobiales bacterium]